MHDPEVIGRLGLLLSPQIIYQVPYSTNDKQSTSAGTTDNKPMVCKCNPADWGYPANENLWINSTVAFREGCTEHEQVAVGTE